MVLTLPQLRGRQEVTDAVKKMVQRVEAGEIRSSDITETLLSEHLYTASMPDPDLLIRTAGVPHQQFSPLADCLRRDLHDPDLLA